MRRRYRNPPVQEAIFEAQFNIDSFDNAIPGQVFDRIKKKYPTKRDIQTKIFHLVGNETNPPAPPPELFRRPIIQAINHDGSELIQIGPGLAVANRIKYTSWEDFRLAIQDVLNAYIDLASPNLIQRMGVRYINKFIIKTNDININDYFNIGIKVPDITSPIFRIQKNHFSRFNFVVTDCFS